MINYGYPEVFTDEGVNMQLLMTDGTVTVSGDNYTITGMTVAITNSMIEAESFELNQSICSNDQLLFGSCESASITFVLHDTTIGLKNKVLKTYLIPDNKASRMLQLGVFKVVGDDMSADRRKRTITAYDALYDIINADVTAWYNVELPLATSTKTLSQFRADFLSNFSITAESTTLVNDSIIITRTIEPETLSGADVIKAICELNGVFGMITNEGKFRFLELQADIDTPGLFPRNTLYPANDLYPEDINRDAVVEQSRYIDVQFEDYQAQSITQLVMRTDDNDVGVTVGTSGNTYTITGNFLVYGYNNTVLTTVATNILSKITNRYYTPCTVNAIGNPVREVGDPLRIETKYRSVLMYMLERRLSGIQALRDTYTAQGEQYYSEQLNSVSTQLKQKVDKDSIVIDLDGHMNNTITIKPDSITFGSNGALIVNTDNFTLDADGNATFSGDISGASISAGNHIEAYENAQEYCRLDSGGVTIKDGSYNGSVSADKIIISYGNSSYITLDVDHGITVTSPYHTIDIDSIDGEIRIDGKRVLTTDDLPT